MPTPSAEHVQFAAEHNLPANSHLHPHDAFSILVITCPVLEHSQLSAEQICEQLALLSVQLGIVYESKLLKTEK